MLDKDNILLPTSSIEELEKDYNDWCLLPYKLRKLSNGTCMARYKCTVPELYLRYKRPLEDFDYVNRVADEDNIKIAESAVLYKYENHTDLLSMSKRMQESPFIVILDPDINSIEVLDAKFDSFNKLSVKNRALSNNYSYCIWGFNVINMYQILKASIEGDNTQVDSDNIIFKDSISEKCMIDAIAPIYDKMLEGICIDDWATVIKLRENVIDYHIKKQIRNIDAENINAVEKISIEAMEVCDLIYKFDGEILMKNIPYYNPREAFEICPNIVLPENSHYHDYCKLYESLEDKDSLLKYGWNPSVEISEKAFTLNRNNIVNFLNEVETVDATKMDFYKHDKPEEDFVIRCNNVKPVYLVFNYFDKENFLGNNYDKVGISFDPTLEKIYTFIGEDRKFEGFKVESIKDDNSYPNDIDVVVIFLEQNICDKLISKCESLVGSFDLQYGFGSVLSIIKYTKNKLSPDNRKITYSIYIDMILRILCMDLERGILQNHLHTLKDFKRFIFRVYNGPNIYYNEDVVKSVKDIVNKLSDKVNYFYNPWYTDESIIK